jgi:small subunit ribosomal protein S16
MLKIRLKKTGRKKKPFYKIVVMDSSSKRDGKSIYDLGFYDPIQKILRFEKLKTFEYLKLGAYPTDTVRHLLLQMIEQKSIYKS